MTGAPDDASHDASARTDRAALRVIVADDHPLYLRGIVRALEAAGEIVLAEAADGSRALELIRRHVPDVAVVDISMPGLDGIDVIGALARHGPPVPVVLLSAFSDEPLALLREHARRPGDRASCVDVIAR